MRNLNKPFADEVWIRVKLSVGLLDKSTKYKLIIFTVLQSLTSVLDLLGVALIGAVVSLSFRTIGSQGSGDRVRRASELLKIDSLSVQHQAAIFMGLAISLFLIKSVFLYYFTRKSFRFLATEGANLSNRYLDKVLNQSLDRLEARSMPVNVHATTYGVQGILSGVIAPTFQLVPDIFLLILLYWGIFLVSPVTAIMSLVLFLSTWVAFYGYYRKRSLNLGKELGEYTIKNSELVTEIFRSFREIRIRQTTGAFIDRVSSNRSRISNTQVKLKSIPILSRLMFENIFLLGICFVVAWELSKSTLIESSGVVTVFLAASSRILPAYLRLNQNISMIRSNVGSTRVTYEILHDLSQERPFIKSSDSGHRTAKVFTPSVEINSLTYRHSGASTPLFDELSLQINEGIFLALTGPSGSGKSTLVDLILGVRTPYSGRISISKVDPHTALSRWRGKIAYVPQNVYISNASLKENLLLGLDETLIESDSAKEIIEQCGLLELEKDMQKCLNLKVGETGIKLSGGQKQRVGLARALLTNPKLLILDETTSSLDGNSEERIRVLLENMKGVTRIIVAHRLSVIQYADKIIYLEKGNISGEGTFDSLYENNLSFRSQVENFKINRHNF